MRKKKIIFTIILCLVCVLFSALPVFAAPTPTPTPLTANMGDFINKDWTYSGDGSEAIKNVGGTAIAILQVIGVTIAIAMLLFVAMKYMMAAPNERAEIKKNMVPYVVGAIIMFGITGFLTILSNFIINASKQF